MAIVFACGLLHGLGFASSMTSMGLDGAHRLLSLLGFNVGVELGQLAIVALFLPVAYALRRTRFYRWAVFVGGSALIAAVSAGWFVDRAFGLALMPF